MTPTDALKAILALVGNVNHSTGHGPHAAKLRGDLLNDIRRVAQEGVGSKPTEAMILGRNKEGDPIMLVNIGPVDFTLLRRQKEDLLKLQTEQESLVKPGATDPVSQTHRAHFYAIEGIINILDKIQDQAVEAGIPEKLVFPQSKE